MSLRTRGPVVARIVCDVCGNRDVGSVSRERRWFLYEARQYPADSDRAVVQSREWALEAQGEQEVACADHGGSLFFSVGELMERVRRLAPGAPPATVRARRAQRL
ncbi:hypothetical protein BH18ACT1_BH18ACT1_01100 [soil metagenome]